jgi:hypothetical protein
VTAPTQAPALQAEVALQAFWSSQVFPSAAGGFVHAPVAGAQVPATWQVSLATQVSGLAPAQTPA